MHVQYRAFNASQKSGTEAETTSPVTTSANTCPVEGVSGAMSGLNVNECPVMHKKEEKKEFIHKVYDENVKI